MKDIETVLKNLIPYKFKVKKKASNKENFWPRWFHWSILLNFKEEVTPGLHTFRKWRRRGRLPNSSTVTKTLERKLQTNIPHEHRHENS